MLSFHSLFKFSDAVLVSFCFTKILNNNIAIQMRKNGTSSKAKISTELKDLKNSFSHCSTPKMLLTSSILHLCTWKWWMEHIAPFYVRWIEKYPRLSSPLNWIVKKTFYAQFCGGSSKNEVMNVVERLKKNRVGSILDPAMEEDLKELSLPEGMINQGKNLPWIMLQSKSNQIDQSSVDDRIKLIKDCIHMATGQSNETRTSAPQFVAIKLTCLVPTGLLYQMTLSLDSIINALDPKKDSTLQTMITNNMWNDYIKVCRQNNPNASIFLDNLEKFVKEKLFSKYKQGLPARMIAFSLPSELLFGHYFHVYLPSLNQSKAEALEKKEEWINKFSMILDNGKKIIQDIIDTASKNQVSVMIDAEQTYFQTAIHCLTLQINPSLDTLNSPTVYGTYQMYLKEGPYQLYSDIIMAELANIPFALKLVRGAYMDGERSRASLLQLTDPICESIERTHEQYYSGLKHLFTDPKRRVKGIFVASHNQETLEYASNYIDDKKTLENNDNRLIMFGQLLGMSDHLTYSLAGKGFYSYKYVPVGTVHQVLPYLLRRARENSSILGRAATERKQIDLVLKSRFTRSR